MVVIQFVWIISYFNALTICKNGQTVFGSKQADAVLKYMFEHEPILPNQKLCHLGTKHTFIQNTHKYQASFLVILKLKITRLAGKLREKTRKMGPIGAFEDTHFLSDYWVVPTLKCVSSNTILCVLKNFEYTVSVDI